MPKSDLLNFDLNLHCETFQYRTPMKFGGRVVRDVTVLSADCDAESELGQARGHGSMTMGVAWAWPDSSIDDAKKLEVVLDLSRRLAASMLDDARTGHPLDLCHRRLDSRWQDAKDIAQQHGLSQPIPPLAVLMAASPIEAALFDAHGKAAGQSAYALLSREHLPNDMAHYLDDPSYRGVYLDQWISPTPTAQLPLYHLVGALDPLTDQDVDQPVGDGIPETLGQWIERDGLTHLKIKLDGSDLDWDVSRVANIFDVTQQTESGRQTSWSFSLDFNERCDDEAYVLSMLDRLEKTSPQAMTCIQYIEQPTHRDLDSHPEITMHKVASRLPVVIDESLIDLKSLRTAISQGYSGIALKACKGHAEAILLGAVARRENLYLCVQDLTCVGASLLHSASLAAHIPGVAAVESNGRQYCPQGNAGWMDSYADFFEIRNGSLPTGRLGGPGLGYESP
tara:strand:+ start:68721 stop:70076 length:1356 start_codon:yes stop_codon:yes gene_type:complete